ncbi:MAG: LuxR C-terminal-related transcriptional regulator [Synergistaceae bacterium]|nr:LuxR C-terminal-related transcriptional regulator [Synergistaceae bacterium]
MTVFDNAAQSRIVRVIAPAGYGKTVSAMLWTRGRRKKAVWFTVRGHEDAPGIFYRRLCETLLGARPESEALRGSLESPLFSLSPVGHVCEALSGMRREEAAVGMELVLVIDDIQNVSNVRVLKSLPRVLRMMPENIIVALIGRGCAGLESLPWGRGRAIGIETLKFSLGEARECFALLGSKLGYQEARRLMASSEGWPIAVHAAALFGYAPGKCSKEEILERCLDEYFSEAIDDDARSILLETRYLDELSEGLCEKITGRAGCSGVLEKLASSSGLLLRAGHGEYVRNPLFTDFMRGKPCCGHGLGPGESMAAASWHCFAAGDIYRSVYYGFQCGSDSNLPASLQELAKHIPDGLSAEARAKAALSELESTLAVSPVGWVDGSPCRLMHSVWRDFASGDAAGLKASVGELRRAIPQIAATNPEYVAAAVVASLLDPEAEAEGAPSPLPDGAAVPDGKPLLLATFASRFPFLHRGVVDFSGGEWRLGDGLAQALSGIPAIGFGAIESCVTGGILYEKNALAEALERARQVRGAGGDPLKTHSPAPEIMYSAMMLEAAALDAMEDEERVAGAMKEISDFIRRERAPHLMPGFSAYATKVRLQNGHRRAASEWLSNYFVDDGNEADIGMMTLHLTTARALLVEGERDAARAFINSLIGLAERFDRLLDRAELLILLGMLEWHRGSPKKAAEPLKEAIRLTQGPRFIRVFADEGASVLPMIKQLMAASSRRGYSGEADPTYLKELYLVTYARSKRRAGIASVMDTKPVRLSRRQALVIRLLSRGYRNADIAAEVGLDVTTVKFHVSSAYKKLGASNSAEAVMKAKALGLLDEPRPE